MGRDNYYEYDFYKMLGQLLRSKRTAANLTLEDVASALGLSIKTVQRYETGERKITIQTIKNMCALYGVDPDEIMAQAQTTLDTDLKIDPKVIALQKAFDDRPEMRVLFSVAESATKEDIERAIKIIEALKGEDDM